MKLTDVYAPSTLDDVVGQPCMFVLKNFVRNPFPTCFLLEGARGTGKTSAAYAMAHALGAEEGVFNGLYVTNCAELGVAEAKRMLKQQLRFKQTNPWKVWILEEMDYLSRECQTFLKQALDRDLPGDCIVVACSNGTDKLSKPFMDRFTSLRFVSNGEFLQSCEERLRMIWAEEMGKLPGAMQIPFPAESVLKLDEDGEFSMRRAIDNMHRTMMSMNMEVMARMAQRA